MTSVGKKVHTEHTTNTKTKTTSKDYSSKIEEATKVLVHYIQPYTTFYQEDDEGNTIAGDDGEPILDETAQQAFDDGLKQCVDQLIKFAKLGAASNTDAPKIKMLEAKIKALENELKEAKTHTPGTGNTPPHSKIMNLIKPTNLDRPEIGGLEITIADEPRFKPDSKVGPNYEALDEKPSGSMTLRELYDFLKPSLRTSEGKPATGMTLASCLYGILDQESLDRLLPLYDRSTTQSSQGKSKGSAAKSKNSSGEGRQSNPFNQFTSAITSVYRTVQAGKGVSVKGSTAHDARLPTFFKPEIEGDGTKLNPPKSWDTYSQDPRIFPLGQYIRVQDALRTLLEIIGSAGGGTLKINGILWGLGLKKLWGHDDLIAEANEQGERALNETPKSKAKATAVRKTHVEEVEQDDQEDNEQADQEDDE